MVWLWRDLENHLVANPCHRLGHLPLDQIAQRSHPTWPWTLPGMCWLQQAQGAVVFLDCKCTLQGHAELLVTQHPKSFSSRLSGIMLTAPNPFSSQFVLGIGIAVTHVHLGEEAGLCFTHVHHCLNFFRVSVSIQWEIDGNSSAQMCPWSRLCCEV